MANVPVFFNGERKLVKMPLKKVTFDELEKIIRNRFPALADSSCAIEVLAETPDGEKNHIQDDTDLGPVRHQLKGLHIRSVTKSVMIDGERYPIDQIPPPESALVLKMIKELETGICGVETLAFEDIFKTLRSVADLFQVAAQASNTPGVEKGSYDIVTFLTELSQEAVDFYTKCKTTCNNVVETGKIAGTFYRDGLRDFANKQMATLECVSSNMMDECTKLSTKVKEGNTQIEVMLDSVSEGIGKQKANLNERKRVSREKEIHAREVKRRKQNVSEFKAELENRRDRHGTSTTDGSGKALVASSIPDPICKVMGFGAMLAFESGFDYFLSKYRRDERFLIELREDEAAAKVEFRRLVHRLKDLNSVDVLTIRECLHIVRGQLHIMQSSLESMNLFWQSLKSSFFGTQQHKEMSMSANSSSVQSTSAGQAPPCTRICPTTHATGKQMLEYLARWVAFTEHCKRCQDAVMRKIKPLHDLMKRNLKPKEALKMLPEISESILEDLWGEE